MNIDQSDPEAVAMVNEIFPDAEIRSYTVYQRLGRHWRLLLHCFGIHDDVVTYSVNLNSRERPAPIVKQLECSICHRPNGPTEIL